MFLFAVLPRFAITSVEFKFVARQAVGSVVIRAAKLKLLQKVELESTLRNLLPQLTTLYFAARQVGQKVVIRATECFKLQCNNVARQVEAKYCPYYRTLRRKNETTNAKCNINAKCHGQLLTQNVILAQIVTAFDAKYNNFFDANYYNFLTQNMTTSLTRKVTTQNVTTLPLMDKGGNLDTVLMFFSSLATPVRQIIQTYLLRDQFKNLKELTWL